MTTQINIIHYFFVYIEFNLELNKDTKDTINYIFKQKLQKDTTENRQTGK